MSTRHLKDHLEKLNAFREIARARSIHQAAKNMRLSQPALSQAMRILEDTLGQSLFTRSPKGVELTPSGRKLLHFSERLISEAEGVEHGIRHPEHTMTGTLTLGAYASLMAYLLPPFLSHMAKKYDRLQLQLSTIQSDDSATALINRRCHFVIGTVKLKQKSITQFELYRDAYGLYMLAPSLRSRTDANLDTSKLPLITVPSARSEDGITLAKLLSDAKVSNPQPYDLDRFESVKALVLEDLGVGVLPIRLAAADVQAGRLVAVDLPRIGKTFGVHSIYVSTLARNRVDVRISTTLQELRVWSQRRL